MVNIRNEIKEAFEVRAHEIGFCLDQRWGQYENPYTNNDTALAYNLFKDGWIAANNIRDEELNGCVVVPATLSLELAKKRAEYIYQNAKKYLDREYRNLSANQMQLFKERWIESKAVSLQTDYLLTLEAARENNHE